MRKVAHSSTVPLKCKLPVASRFRRPVRRESRRARVTEAEIFGINLGDSTTRNHLISRTRSE